MVLIFLIYNYLCIVIVIKTTIVKFLIICVVNILLGLVVSSLASSKGKKLCIENDTLLMLIYLFPG